MLTIPMDKVDNVQVQIAKQTDGTKIKCNRNEECLDGLICRSDVAEESLSLRISKEKPPKLKKIIKF